MSCSVNLVPVARLQAHALARRRRAWIGLCTAGGLLVGLSWGAQNVTRRAVTHLEERAEALGAQRSLIQNQVSAAQEQRDGVLARLKLISAARRGQPWAGRLARLTRSVPDGVFLTQMTVSARTEPQSAAARAGAVSSAQAPALRPAASPVHDVRLEGLALDHTGLIQLLHTLQNSADWEHVELVRATSEPYAGRNVVAFEFDCRTAELAK